jgi:hypothetical protein
MQCQMVGGMWMISCRGGSSHGLFQGIILRFALRDWGKPQKISARTADLQAKIQNWDLPNMKQESWLLSCDVKNWNQKAVLIFTYRNGNKLYSNILLVFCHGWKLVRTFK